MSLQKILADNKDLEVNILVPAFYSKIDHVHTDNVKHIDISPYNIEDNDNVSYWIADAYELNYTLYANTGHIAEDSEIIILINDPFYGNEV